MVSNCLNIQLVYHKYHCNMNILKTKYDYKLNIFRKCYRIWIMRENSYRYWRPNFGKLQLKKFLFLKDPIRSIIRSDFDIISKYHFFWIDFAKWFTRMFINISSFEKSFEKYPVKLFEKHIHHLMYLYKIAFHLK